MSQQIQPGNVTNVSKKEWMKWMILNEINVNEIKMNVIINWIIEESHFCIFVLLDFCHFLCLKFEK